MNNLEIRNEELADTIRNFLITNDDQKTRHNALLNLKLEECDIDNMKITFRFDVEGDWCLNPYGGVHGGVSCSIFDTAMGTGATALACEYVTTTDISVNFLKPMLGRHFRVVCEYTHIGNKVLRCNAKLTDIDSGKLCTMAMAGFMRVKRSIVK